MNKTVLCVAEQGAIGGGRGSWGEAPAKTAINEGPIQFFFPIDTCATRYMCIIFKTYETFSVLTNSYINTSANWKNANLFSQNLEFFQFPCVGD